MKVLSTTLALIGLFFSQQVLATVVSPASATASSTFSTYSLPNLINGVGITGGLDGGTHSTDYTTMWMSDAGDVNAQLTFDLGAVESVNAARIWQYNATCCGLERGVDGFDVYYSSDDINYTLLGSFNLTMSQSVSNEEVPAQIVPMSFSAQFIRFNITSNHGSEGYTGLSEVAFDVNNQPSVPVPALSGFMLMVMLLLLAGFAAVRLRSH